MGKLLWESGRVIYVGVGVGVKMIVALPRCHNGLFSHCFGMLECFLFKSVVFFCESPLSIGGFVCVYCPISSFVLCVRNSKGGIFK